MAKNIKDKLARLTKIELEDGIESATRNIIIESTTNDYIAKILKDDPLVIPPSYTTEHTLLKDINDTIEVARTLTQKGNNMSYLETLTPWQVAQLILAFHPVRSIAMSGITASSEYDILGLYQNSGENEGLYSTSRVEMQKLINSYNISLNDNQITQTINLITAGAPRSEPTRERDLVAVNNGIFNYATKELHPFSSEYIFLSKSKVDYVENPKNPVIFNEEDQTYWDVDSWMEELSDDPEIVNLLWEIMGAVIRPNVRWDKSAWFYSEVGNNGKGTLCTLMRNLCGPGSHTSIPLDDFSKDFYLEPLVTSSAIIVDENDVGTYIDKAANLKAVITNDVILINRKFRAPIAHTFYGFMIQCLNEFPRIKDRSDSFYRRQLFVPFEKSFTGRERKYIKDDYLNREEVLQYVLHKVLNTNFYRLSEPKASLLTLEEYKAYNDTIRDFMDEFSDSFVWDLLPYSFLYDLYRPWHTKNHPNGGMVGRNTFIKNLRGIIKDYPEWEASHTKQRIRSQGRMEKSEPLINKWHLSDWYNPNYQGSDLAKRATPEPAQAYSGLLRTDSQ